jgi:flagellar biosynthesis protein FlhF
MQIKRFEGRDIQEALKRVKEELGLEAIILSTQKVKKPSHRLGFPHRPIVEVVAAIDRPIDPPVRSTARSPSFTEQKKLEEEAMIQRILSAGFFPEFVHGLSEEIRTLRKEFEGWSLPEAYRRLLRWKLMEQVEVADPSLNGTKIWSFIGPTGVGKTTTMVKLAAHFSLKVTPKVTLITIDTYRIGAVDQLKTYAQILRLPLEIALHREGLRQIIEKNMDQDLLLIDTAGRSPNAMDQIEELKGFLTVHPRIENHLILSATTKESDLDRMVQQFSLLPIKSYIFTKIDETDEYVPLFNQLLRHKRPLSYLTKGQKVPEDIELATKARVANLILNTLRWN